MKTEMKQSQNKEQIKKTECLEKEEQVNEKLTEEEKQQSKEHEQVLEKWKMQKKKDSESKSDSENIDALMQTCTCFMLENKRIHQEYRRLKKEISKMYLIFIVICLSLFLFELSIILVKSYF